MITTAIQIMLRNTFMIPPGSGDPEGAYSEARMKSGMAKSVRAVDAIRGSAICAAR
jgi:hypothetical protein